MIVKFSSGTGLFVGWGGSGGGLQAVGTPTSPITFTSSAASPTRGSWRCINFTSTALSTSRLAYATVSWAGSSENAGVYVDRSSPTLDNVTVTNSSGTGITVTGAGANPTISSTALTSNSGAGLYLTDSATASLTGLTATGNGGFAISQEPGVTLTAASSLLATGNGTNAIELRGGDVGASTTWKTTELPYVATGNVFVHGASSPVLAIEPGVTVKFSSGTGLFVGWNYSGGLQAVGTPASPITFTSSAASPTRGSWRCINFTNKALSTSRLAYATVSWAGNAESAGVYVDRSSPTLDNVTVTNSSGSGITVTGAGANPTISSATLTNNSGVGLYLTGSATATLTGLTATGNGGFAISQEPGVTLTAASSLLATGNGTNAIELRGGNVGASTTWKTTELHYVATGHVFVQGASSPVLAIEPGVTVKFSSGIGLFVGGGGPGGLQAVGTLASPITFTSSAASPTRGSWRCINFTSTALSTSRLAYATVSWAGNSENAGVYVDRSSPTLDNVTVTNSSGTGITVTGVGANPTISSATLTNSSGVGLWLLAGSTPRVYGNTISENASAGIQNESSRATIRFNTMSGNSAQGLLNVNGALAVRDNSVSSNGAPARNNDPTSKTFDVRQQWWGSTSPPTGLVGRVESDPWLGSPPTPLFAVTTFARSTASFNPEGAEVRFSFTFPSSASWALTLSNGGGTDVRTFTGSGTSGSVAWNGRDAGGAVLPDGTYAYRLTATETATSTAAAPLLGRATLDRTIPLAALTAPLEGDSVSSPIAVTGTAAGTGFTSYVLEHASGEFPATWTAVDRGSLAVTAGTLGLWSAILTDPVYTLRLTVNGTGDKSAVQTLTVRPADQTACQ